MRTTRTYSLKEETLQMLKRLSDKNDESMSSVIDKAVKEYYEEEMKDVEIR